MKRFSLTHYQFIGGMAACIYFAWNAYWFSQWRLAPSLFKSVTGWPAPTTGCTRALGQLWMGNITESIRYNPLAVPIALMFGATLSTVAVSAVRRRSLMLSNRWFVAWAVLLAVAWIVKLAGDTQYW